MNASPSLKKKLKNPVSSKASREKPSASKTQKRLAVALQGGGSHGAYSWGVLDALLENPNIHFEGICGTSAGAMNAAACAQGLNQNGNQHARELLAQYWGKIGDMGKDSFLKPLPWHKAMHNYSISNTPGYQFLQQLTSNLSPYQFNPQNQHPLRTIIEGMFDFEVLKKEKNCKLFLCATHVATGKLKIFNADTLSSDAVLASACVPNLFQAIEIEGEMYWDGGFIGNPAIYPLIYNCETTDLLIVQIRRVYDPVVPTSVADIQNRLGEITQNACLNREMRSIAYISKLIDDGVIAPNALKRLHMHTIRDDAFWGTVDRASGFCSDPEFLQYLFKAGRRAGKQWLHNHFNDIGVRTTADIEGDYI